MVDGSDFRFVVRTSDGEWRMQVQVYERERIIRLYVYLNDSAFPSSRIAYLRELVERLNATVVHGRFVWDRGQVRFENGIDFSYRRRSVGAVEREFKACAFPLSLWNHVVSLIDKPEIDAKEALEYALLMEGAIENPSTVRPSTIKLALHVLEGGRCEDHQRSRVRPQLSLVP